MIPYRFRPGAGFVVLALSLVGAALFFVWALRTPPLDEAWRMQIELSLGERKPLSGAEFALLQRTLERYPEWATSVLDGEPAGFFSANHNGRIGNGYAYLIRTTAAPLALQVRQAAAGTEPLPVEVRTAGWKEEGTLSAEAPFLSLLPSDGPFPQLIEVRVATRKKERRAPEVAPVISLVAPP